MITEPSTLLSRPNPSSHLHRPFTIAAIRTENYRTKTLVFHASLPAQPGQFVMAWLPGVDEKPFSIASAEPLALTVVAVGPFSEALHRLAIGDRVWIRGPLGQGYQLEGKRLLLVGGGYGVAPLLFLARIAIAAGCAVQVCIGARTAVEVLLVEDLQRAGVSVTITTEDGSLGMAGLVTTATEAAISSHRPDAVYACGPVKMLEAIDRQCEAYNLSRQLSWEAHMRCGIGLCGSCETSSSQPAAQRGSGWLVCLDGPVSFSR
jgi:dihydroorotate dehydrogenase electron transfer subunit